MLNPDIELSDPLGLGRAAAVHAGPERRLRLPVAVEPGRHAARRTSARSSRPLALLRRHLLKQPQRRVDWVSAAFWLVPHAVWRRLGGFDEGYYMYCEDVDFCLRLQLAGWQLRAGRDRRDP